MVRVELLPTLSFVTIVGSTGGAAIAETPAAALCLIPRPVEVRTTPGAFVITPTTTVIASGAATIEARKLHDYLAPAMGCRLRLTDGAEPRDGAIALCLDDSLAKLGDEGYRLEVTPERIVIRAPGATGVFRGIQTLRQLLPPAVFRAAPVQGITWAVPCVEITDYPRFRWRGMMLETVYHFLPKSFILKFIDVMALHKFSVLHLHLTDDQGWRVEIRKYSKLTEVGAWRDETVIGHVDKDLPLRYDGRPHGGFYTQDDIREIVRYAADRHIDVVPEIEMPGHARAAIAAYPELGVYPEKHLRPWTRWGICEDIFNASDSTISFLQDVLVEVMELFPSRFVHIGGDEAVKNQWEASPAVQARIKALGLKNEAELQSWFIRQMDTFLTRRGRRLVGWDEILEGGLAPGAVVMSWQGEEGGIAAARAGHDVVMTPRQWTYFDYYQGPPEKEPLAFGEFLPLPKVYAYEPIPASLNAEQAKHILGVQGQLWGEYMPDPRHVEYMAFPRAAALAEVAWSPGGRPDYRAFVARLLGHLKRLDALDVNYRRLDASDRQ
jgi:hexosaminidase